MPPSPRPFRPPVLTPLGHGRRRCRSSMTWHPGSRRHAPHGSGQLRQSRRCCHGCSGPARRSPQLDGPDPVWLPPRRPSKVIGTRMSTTPIADYALLSDRHSAALVSRDGSIDWQCFPRFDSPSIFGRLLGEEAGYWSIRPVNVTQITRRYLDRTMVLETTFRTSTGTAAISDALAMGSGNRGHELGRGAPHLLLRRVTCLEGHVDVSLEYVPRPEYGLVHPLLQTVEGGVTASGGSDLLVLSSPVALAVDPERSVVSGQLQLRRGESACFALHHSKQSDSEAARVWSQIEIGTRFDDTVSAWE